MDGKAKFIFPTLITAVIVFVVSAVVTFENIGLRDDFLARRLSAVAIGRPVGALTAFLVISPVRTAPQRLVAMIERQA